MIMENTSIKELPAEVQKRIDAVVESEFDLDIRVFTLAPAEGDKQPQAFGSIALCTPSCSCLTCLGHESCWTCTCWPHC
jgi:hypothetical protein